MVKRFEIYLALGDSMSLDEHPRSDAVQRGVIPEGSEPGLGAASLFYRNADALFEEFRQRDLVSRFEGVEHANLAVQNATADDITKIIHSGKLDSYSARPSLVTVTIGVKDLLNAYRNGGDRAGVFRQMKILLEQYEQLARALRRKLSSSTIIITTVFDPTDGTGIMPASSTYGKMPVEYIDQFNNYVKQTAVDNDLKVADVHSHFCKHGALCGAADRFWYCKTNPTEPNHLGASEIRRVWLDALEVALG
jgi:hypothetical protein